MIISFIWNSANICPSPMHFPASEFKSLVMQNRRLLLLENVNKLLTFDRIFVIFHSTFIKTSIESIIFVKQNEIVNALALVYQWQWYILTKLSPCPCRAISAGFTCLSPRSCLPPPFTRNSSAAEM